MNIGFSTMTLPAERHVIAPDGSDVRVLLELSGGGMTHFQLLAATGILGVRGGLGEECQDNGWEDLVELALAGRAYPDPLYPPWLIGIYTWGCAIWSLIDCRDPAGPMWSWDGNSGMLRQHDQAIADWLAVWLECRLEMPEGTDPAHR